MATPTLIYDDACPMCKAYTTAFTKLNWSNRTPFSEVDPTELPALDFNRGRHEIPLYNPETGEVHYGLETMTMVIAKALPYLKPIIRNPIFVAALKPLYWLITYNRRVIAGTKPPATGFDCAPDFHLGWRLTYILLALTVVVAIGSLPIILMAGLGLTMVASLLVNPNSKLNTLGHIVTIAVMAALVITIIPNAVGIALAYVITGGELWRRLI